MGVSKHSYEEKKSIIIEYLKNHAGKSSQGVMAKDLMYDLGYQTDMSAKVAIGRLLDRMLGEGIAYFKEEKPKRGYIPMKVWYLKEENGFQDLSGTE